MTAIATLGRIRPDDVRPLARLHRTAFPGFFLSTLGEGFLVQFYRGYLTEKTAVTVVARAADGIVMGAAVGTTDPVGFFARLMRQRWPGFALASVRSVVTEPRSARRLFRAVSYRGDAPADVQGALLSSIFIDPSLQRSGLGRQLLAAWIGEAAAQGASRAFLSTDAEGNDVVNRFYQMQGWVLSDRYITREGRRMNRYSISLERT